MIKWILIPLLLLCLLYAFLQRKKSRAVAGGILVVSLAGIYFVLVPEHTSALAEVVGVGRGADLIFYFWVVISVLVLMSLQFKILGLQREMTELSRELALRHPRLASDANAGARTTPI